MQAFDFDDAITMHRSWKMKFHLAIDAIRGQDFDTQAIGDEAQCALGKWLAANAGELKAFASAAELLTVHQEFHRQAAAIADAIRNARVVRLNDKAIVEFGILSARIEALLARLKADLGSAG